MKNKSYGDSIKLYSLSGLAILLPLGVIWIRSRPIHAKSAGELWVQMFSQERSNIEAELGQRSPDTVGKGETMARWQILEQSMINQGATPSEIKVVMAAAKEFCPLDNKAKKELPYWPILIKRGYVQDKSVWVSVGAAKSETPLEAEIVTGWNYYVQAINPQKPHGINSTYSSTQIFPRCAGPNSPFPISP